MKNGEEIQIVTDQSWLCHLARSWKPGQYKRWYLRALQEEFDARKYPHGWTAVDFKPNADWLSPTLLTGAANKPALNTNSADYLYNSSGGGNATELGKRSVPLRTGLLYYISTFL